MNKFIKNKDVLIKMKSDAAGMNLKTKINRGKNRSSKKTVANGKGRSPKSQQADLMKRGISKRFQETTMKMLQMQKRQMIIAEELSQAIKEGNREKMLILAKKNQMFSMQSMGAVKQMQKLTMHLQRI